MIAALFTQRTEDLDASPTPTSSWHQARQDRAADAAPPRRHAGADQENDGAGGVFVVWSALPFARTPAVQAAYAVFCVLSLIYLAPQFIRQVRRQWRYCTALGSLDADIAVRRHL